MKLLRILTGNPAGAQARLGHGVHRIDSDDDADIRITDWTGPGVLIEVNDADVVTVRHVVAETEAAHEAAQEDAAADATPETEAPDNETPGNETPDGASPQQDTSTVLMLDFLPMQFDQTVLCIGPDDTPWPTDLSLLSTLLIKPEDAANDEAAETRKRRSRRKAFVAFGAFMVIALAGSIGALSLTSRANASLQPVDVASMESANRWFAAAHLNELRATLDGRGGIVVKGIVANDSEDATTRRLLQGMAKPRVQRDYSVAEDTARGIREALGVANIGVRYVGAGVFSITGTGIDMDALQQGVQRVRPDLSSNVKELRVDATGADASPEEPAGASYTAVVSSDRVRYAQTADGVKHIFILDNGDQDADSTDAAASDALTNNAARQALSDAP